MDEPTVAVDPQARNSILEGIQRLHAQGSTIVYTSHYMEEVEQICTRIAIMDKGRVVALGTKEELKNMINLGESITAELMTPHDASLEDGLRGLPGVISVQPEDSNLVIRTAKGQTSLAAVMAYMDSKGVPYGRVWAQRPTLNDVFLEITGKTLRDSPAM